MTTKFNYTPKAFQLSDLWAFVLVLVLIIGPIVYPFSVGFRRAGITLLPYPYTVVVFSIAGILLLFFKVRSMMREAKMRQSPEPIVVDGDTVVYPKIKGGLVEKEVFLISQVTRVDYDKEDNELTLYTDSGKHTFDGDFFESSMLFDQFRGLFNK